MKLQIALTPKLEVIPCADSDVEELLLRALWEKLKPAVLEFQNEHHRGEGTAVPLRGPSEA
jgi:hypothetical protein